MMDRFLSVLHKVTNPEIINYIELLPSISALFGLDENCFVCFLWCYLWYLPPSFLPFSCCKAICLVINFPSAAVDLSMMAATERSYLPLWDLLFSSVIEVCNRGRLFVLLKKHTHTMENNDCISALPGTKQGTIILHPHKEMSHFRNRKTEWQVRKCLSSYRPKKVSNTSTYRTDISDVKSITWELHNNK